jgi:hypothetical protein
MLLKVAFIEQSPRCESGRRIFERSAPVPFATHENARVMLSEPSTDTLCPALLGLHGRLEMSPKPPSAQHKVTQCEYEFEFVNKAN